MILSGVVQLSGDVQLSGNFLFFFWESFTLISSLLLPFVVYFSYFPIPCVNALPPLHVFKRMNLWLFLSGIWFTYHSAWNQLSLSAPMVSFSFDCFLQLHLLLEVLHKATPITVNHSSHISQYCLIFLSSDTRLSKLPTCSHWNRSCLRCSPALVKTSALTAVWDQDSSMLIWKIHLGHCVPPDGGFWSSGKCCYSYSSWVAAHILPRCQLEQCALLLKVPGWTALQNAMPCLCDVPCPACPPCLLWFCLFVLPRAV